jgi:hypothetical protein
MYINFKILQSRGLSVFELGLLLAIKQNRTEDTSEYLSINLSEYIKNKFEDSKLIENVKLKKKSDSIFKTFRTSSKGNQWIEDIESPEVDEGSLKMRDYLIDMYLNHEDQDRSIGNRKKIGIYISILRTHLNLNLHEFFYLCEYFLQEYPYTKILEYIFFNSNKNRYGKFKDNIEDSSLFQFFIERRLEVENYWKIKIVN